MAKSLSSETRLLPPVGLVPAFETRTDGPYAYLNSGLYLSSNPGIANGGVKITDDDSTK